MKQIQFLVCGLVALAMASMAPNLSAQTAQEGIAKVINIKGNARYMTTANSTWQPLKSGMILKSGAVIQTATGSYVDLALNNANAVANPVRPTPIDVGYSAPKAEQDAIRVFENTVLGVDKLVINETGAETVTETQLDLKAGKIFGTVKKLSASSKYEVKIPNGVAGIRGTIYMLSSEGILTVLSGSVVLAFVGTDGSVITQVINAGQQFDARTGQITPIPTGMLGDLVKDASSLHMMNGQATSFTDDERVYYVSPVHGHGHGKGGGGNGGGGGGGQ